MDFIRYGVFALGQLWTVVGDDGERLAFVTRTQAIEAAEGLVTLQAARGRSAELVVQGEDGFLSNDRKARRGVR